MRKSRRKENNKKPILAFTRFNEAIANMTVRTHETVREAWQEIDPERRKEILAILLIVLSLISFFALISYHPKDLATYSLNSPGPDHSFQNWIGKPGAWLAHGIIFTFGASGYSLPALFMIWGIDRLRRGSDAPLRKIRLLGFFLLLITLSIFLGLLTELFFAGTNEEQIWRVCGAIGYILSRRLLELGMVGSLIINVALLSLSALLCTPFLFKDLFSRIYQFIFLNKVSVEEEMAGELDEDYDTGLSPFRRKSGIELAPLREATEIETQGFYSPAIYVPGEENPVRNDTLITSEKYGDNALPPLECSENTDLRIVTTESESLKEVDLGINLVHTPDNTNYQIPPISLLEKSDRERPEVARDEIIYNSQILEQTLKDFNISAKVVEVNYGPTITCYELEPAPGIKISRIENLANDITRALKACSVRIVAPIPGKGTVGVEVPNRQRTDVFLREIIACEAYQNMKSKLKFGLGKTISGDPFVFDLIRAPHLLVAGATGSGKSVCINTIITSILYNAAPHEVKLLLVDPKQVELALYRNIPHLLSPVVTDAKKAGAALRWAVEEMETRYRYLKKVGVRNLKEFNKKRLAQQEGDIAETESSAILPRFLPYIVIVIDELADLMMIVRVEVESVIARLAAMARAVGIHLVIATQRPSVDVLTGVIKNNFPSRIAFQVSSTADSRTILDMKGADALLGRGDMLLSPGGAGRPLRLQGAFVSTEDVEDIVEFVRDQQEVEYVQEEFTPIEDSSSASGRNGEESETDELYNEAVQVVLENDAASTSLLQRRLKIGYGRAARLLDLMEENEIVGPPRGSKPREIILNKMP